MTVRRCSGVVLAGGANARFGGVAKGLLEVGGRRVVDRVFDALRDVTDELLLITNDPSVRAGGDAVAVYGDVRQERGSLTGLHSALTRCADAALVVAWDMPFLSSPLLMMLRRAGEEEEAAAIPESTRGLEPLCAYYPRSCLEVVERQLASGEMRLSAFIEALPRRVIVGGDEIARFGAGAPDRLFINVNSAADLAAAQSLVHEHHADLGFVSHSRSQ
jgi:molybdopterin-guanine dinucleotide biosynthesis protein A